EPLPKQVFGHPWLLQGGEKMSKSKGNVIYADDMVDLFGVDASRYFVLHEMPYENDGVITWELLVERINSDLANTLGNLVKRTVSMTNQYFGGVVKNPGVSEPVDEELISLAKATRDLCDKDMETLRVADAMTKVWDLFKRCNKYIDETEPWVLAKDPAAQGRLATVLYNLIESISIGASLIKSFMPETSAAILKELGADEIPYDELDTFGHYPADGSRKVTDAPVTLFERLKLDDVMKKVAVIEAAQKKAAAAEEKKESPKGGKAAAGEAKTADSAKASAGGENVEHKPQVTIDDFDKLEFRVGEILACEPVPKSKKLLCSQVKIGAETKQIVSGIHKYYSPEEMVGKKVMVVVNLQPAKLAGVLSEGMILCAEDESGDLALMKPEKDFAAGAEIC
ncbi:MAG: methionine--tRNA ligase subunit beta, partial [Lachnospiraceae bacterium]|nr:methionine--tRNA ligase subunit beta [Lachnospiraceae bacterium]